MFVFSVIVLALALVTTHTYVILPKEITATGRILYGFDAVDNQFPYAVLLELPIAGAVTYCGGSLIGNKWVLTAAHCVDRKICISVYLGLTHVDYAEVAYTVWKNNIKVHPHWDRVTYNNDIALIEIPHTETCDTIKTVPLPAIAPSYPDYVSRLTVFSGWGQTESAQVSPLLQWLRLRVIKNDACRQRMRGVTAAKLCVRTRNRKSPCFGDSGGPLVLQSTGELIGVLSTVSTFGCDLGYPAMFTRVTSYLDWIKSISGISY